MRTLAINPARTLGELRDLDALTGGEEGARRLAWTDGWAQARAWLRARLEELPVEVAVDAAGNLSATLRGESSRRLVIGSHVDSVPNGGWLDGTLGVLAGLEVLRGLAAGGRPAVTVTLVDWADEEGARFGRSLFGSSAAAGTLDARELRDLVDSDGISLVEAVARHGVALDGIDAARRTLEDVDAYLELHIEQGPVLERRGLPLAAVTGMLGVERHLVHFAGESSHAGSTPMDARRDPLAAAARTALEIRAGAIAAGGVATVGRLDATPGAVTVIARTATLHVDQRHEDAQALSAMLAGAVEASAEIARQERVDVVWDRVLAVPPLGFDADLVDTAAAVVEELTGTAVRLPSGPLHDAAEVARLGIPSAMLFVQSLRGLSHTREEDTRPEHVELAVRALAELAERVVARLAERP